MIHARQHPISSFNRGRGALKFGDDPLPPTLPTRPLFLCHGSSHSMTLKTELRLFVCLVIGLTERGGRRPLELTLPVEHRKKPVHQPAFHFRFDGKRPETFSDPRPPEIDTRRDLFTVRAELLEPQMGVGDPILVKQGWHGCQEIVQTDHDLARRLRSGWIERKGMDECRQRVEDLIILRLPVKQMLFLNLRGHDDLFLESELLR